MIDKSILVDGYNLELSFKIRDDFNSNLHECSAFDFFETCVIAQLIGCAEVTRTKCALGNYNIANVYRINGHTVGVCTIKLVQKEDI